MRFFGIAFPPIILGGIGIMKVNPWLVLPWLGLIVGYFVFVEIRVMCSHCPHYAEPGTRILQCWANYGAPKLWKYRPGPMTRTENIIFIAGLVVVAGYPLAFLIADAQWLFLGVFAISLGAMAILMGHLMCARCMNFACPFNQVDQSVREAFFARNPVVRHGWNADGGNDA